jgi:hypothetical protein
MREQDQVAIRDAMAELCALKDRKDPEKAITIAVAQMRAGALFIEARKGKARADAIVAELYRVQLGA